MTHIKFEEKYRYYFLGWVLGNAVIYDNELVFFFNKNNRDMLHKIITFINNFFAEHNNRNILSYNLTKSDDFVLKYKNKKYIQYIIDLFNLQQTFTHDKIMYSKNMLELSSEFLCDVKPFKIHFLRGVFESSGYTFKEKNMYKCGVRLYSHKFIKQILQLIELEKSVLFNEQFDKYYFTIDNSNALDFLYLLYNDIDITHTKNDLFSESKYKFYKLLKNVSIDYSLPNQNIYYTNLFFNFLKTDISAVTPFKTHGSDSGYDLTLIKKLDSVGKIEMYDTCLQIKPMMGYYFDLVLRSSTMNKWGYSLANSVGIIDASYTGNVKVALIKLDNTKPNLILPATIVQIIPRQIQHLTPIEVFSPFDKTFRNSGGFGSTNIKEISPQLEDDKQSDQMSNSLRKRRGGMDPVILRK